MYYLSITILLFLFAFFIYKQFQDLWSPSLILSVIIAFSSLSSLIGRLSWNFIDLSWQVTIITLLGILSFYLGELFVRYIFRKVNSKEFIIKKIVVSDFLNYIIIAYLLVIIIWLYFEISRITDIQNDISKMIYSYRMNFTEINPDFNRADGLSFLLTQLFKTVLPITITYLYININNIFLEKKIIFRNVIVIVLGFMISLLISGRSEIITMIIFSVFVMIFYMLTCAGTQRKIIIKIVKLVIVIGAVGIPAFYFMLPFMGREVPSGLIEYVTFYLGCPLPSFDYWLSNFYPLSGYETAINFVGLQRVLSKIGVMGTLELAKYKFVSFDCNLSSNAYGFLFNYYNVGGYIGVLSLPFIVSAIISVFKKICFRLSNDASIVIYFYIFSMLIDQYRSEVLFNKVLDYDFIFRMIFIPLLFFVINWFERRKNFHTRNILEVEE